MGNDQNETYAGGSDVGSWVSIPMTKRVLPKTRTELNAAANNGQIDYFITPPELADYYFAKITNSSLAGFRGKLLDYYIEATDARGNVSKSEIQHVFAEDDGAAPTPPAKPTGVSASAISSTQITVTWSTVADATSYVIKRSGTEVGSTTSTSFTNGGLAPSTGYSFTVIARNSASDSPESDPANATTQDPPVPPGTPTGLAANAVSHTQINLAWDAVGGATSYIVKRGGTQIATPTTNSFSDAGLAPLTNYSYTVAASNSAGTSGDSASAAATTQAAPQNFTMDGAADSAGYLVSNPGMTIYAAVRGSRLYIATWSTGNSGGANDHFILVSDTLLPSATAVAPWGKAGTVAVAATKPFLAAESINNYAGWFNAPAGSEVMKSGTSAGQLEGSIDLAAAFGAVPQTVYVAALAYQTTDAGLLGAQAPSGNSDGNVDPAEFFALPVAAIRDTFANGIFDRLDPAREFKLGVSRDEFNDSTIVWPCVPGRAYQVEYCDDLGDGWQAFGGQIQAPSGQDTLSLPDATARTNSQRFYRIRLIGQ
jgi:hypothetical protein